MTMKIGEKVEDKPEAVTDVNDTNRINVSKSINCLAAEEKQYYVPCFILSSLYGPTVLQ